MDVQGVAGGGPGLGVAGGMQQATEAKQEAVAPQKAAPESNEQAKEPAVPGLGENLNVRV